MKPDPYEWKLAIGISVLVCAVIGGIVWMTINLAK
jgi:hypothetical protein